MLFLPAIGVQLSLTLLMEDQLNIKIIIRHPRRRIPKVTVLRLILQPKAIPKGRQPIRPPKDIQIRDMGRHPKITLIRLHIRK